MNILLLSDKLPWPSDSGGAVATADMIRKLHEAGHRVTIIALNSSKHYSDPGSINKAIKELCLIIPVDVDTSISKIDIIKNLLLSNEPYNFSRFRSEKLEKTIRNHLRKNRYDIVQFEGLSLHNYLPLIREQSEAKIAVRAHNVENHIWAGLALETNSLIKKLYFRNLARRVKRTETEFISQADGIIAISKTDLAWFESNSRCKNCILIYPDLRVAEYPQPGSGSRLNDLCFIGSLDWMPNQNGLKWFVRNVLPLVTSEFPALTFRVAGRNPSKEMLSLFNKHSIDYQGEPADSLSFLSDHSIEVVPLFSGSGIRIKILEALAAGTAVVTTAKGAEGLPDEITGELMISDKPDEMARSICSLLKQPQKVESYGRKISGIFYEYFGNLELSERLKSFYSTLIDDN